MTHDEDTDSPPGALADELLRDTINPMLDRGVSVEHLMGALIGVAAVLARLSDNRRNLPGVLREAADGLESEENIADIARTVAASAKVND